MKPMKNLIVYLVVGFCCAPLGAMLSISLEGPNDWDQFAWGFNGILSTLPMLTGLFFAWSSKRAVLVSLTVLTAANVLGQVLAWLGTQSLHGGEAGFFLFPFLVATLGCTMGVAHLMFFGLKSLRQSRNSSS